MAARETRLQTATDRSKALKQYQELRRSGSVVKAIVIAELKDGKFHILGQDLTPNEMAPLLLIAADALERAEANRRIIKLVAHEEPPGRGEWNRSKPRPKEITTDADGVLAPPAGESFISCGECGHPAWFVLHNKYTDQTSRYACAHCGNEVKQIAVHESGHA